MYNTNGLKILNLDYNDDGYYACGYSPFKNSFITFSIYKLFVKSKDKFNSFFLFYC